MALSGGTGLTSSHPHYSPFLHLCILASGAHLSKNPEILSGSGEVERKASPFLHAATSLLVSELEHPKPTTVIGVDLLCLNLSDLHQQWASWVLNGGVLEAQDCLAQLKRGYRHCHSFGPGFRAADQYRPPR